jgi:hypothetical protein
MISIQAVHGLGRAKNAVQDYLIHKLLYPKVYLDAEFNSVKVDVLAIDRTGVGDVHAVRMVPPQGRFIEGGGMVKIGRIVFDSVKELRSLPSHYRYVAVVSDDPETRQFYPADSIVRESFADDGVGRIGVLYVDLTEESPSVRVILKAERFRSSKEIVELADRFVAERLVRRRKWQARALP